MLKNDKKENNIYNNVNTVNGLDTISGLDNVKKLNGIKDANNVYLATVIVVILAFNVILLTVSIFGNILSLFGLNGKSLHDECIEILNDPLIGMFLSQAIILIPAVVFLYNRKKHVKNLLRFNKIDITTFVALTVLTYTLLPVMSFINMFSMIFVKNRISNTVSEIATNRSLILSLLVIAILPAFVEEILCRGILYNSHRKVSIRGAIILNGILFGLLHGNFNQFAYAFFMGMIFSLIVEATDTVISTIWCHFLINGNSMVGAFISNNMQNGEVANTTTEISVRSLLPWGCAAIFALAISILIFIFIAKHNKRYEYLQHELLGKKDSKVVENIEKEDSLDGEVKKGDNRKKMSLLTPGLICAILISVIYMLCVEFLM